MPDSAFPAAVARVLQHEGGYVRDPRDPGGETKFGISKRSYPDLDITTLTAEQAVAIYRRDWWDHCGYARLPAAIGAKMLDLAVNMGAGAAAQLLQRACGGCGRPTPVDGVLGPATVLAVTQCDEAALLAALRAEAAARYRALAAADPTKTRFLSGWLRRAYS